MTEPQGSEGQRWTLHVRPDGTARLHDMVGLCAQTSGKDVEVVPASLLAVAEAKLAEQQEATKSWVHECADLKNALRVAEAKAEEWERECDKHAKECAEALRVAREALDDERKRGDHLNADLAVAEEALRVAEERSAYWYETATKQSEAINDYESRLRVAEERAEKALEAERIATKNAYDYGEKWNGLREQLVAAERKIEFSERKREEAEANYNIEFDRTEKARAENGALADFLWGKNGCTGMMKLMANRLDLETRTIVGEWLTGLAALREGGKK